ncbi:MAG TPA: Asp-tRNA(Asn)/Glu-tRNA(Gln) amidotransferase subunit GatB [Levilinea sp.]|nr:Asp-tRNA(Asn)/Glu-tRNA(Gln) amidotransferase subunit GatB [Levilinea sp.]
MNYEAVIGLEVHAELLTQSKMFCACPVVDVIDAQPNSAICPVCAGLPGVLPVVNRRAIDYALRVALALDCQVAQSSIFERKNYFYPDLPKGYQISQYTYPLAQNGVLCIHTRAGQRTIRIRRVHLEEDTGKLTHITRETESYSLVDLNRAGVPLLEIVSEPDLHTVEEVRAYAIELRSLLRCLGVNSGDMEKGVIRFEANVSVRPAGCSEMGRRVEIKNLNSFRALERAIAFQIEQQISILEADGQVRQQTLGWDEDTGMTYAQRGKEEAHDYRYFPEPDLPPLVVEPQWIEHVKAQLPELPWIKQARFREQYRLSAAITRLLTEEPAVADFFEQVLQATPAVSPQAVANWISGALFGWMNQTGQTINELRTSPTQLGCLTAMQERGDINMNTAKVVLHEMLSTGQTPGEIVQARGLGQVSDSSAIAALVQQVIAEHPNELNHYLSGKETLSTWFFGQVMRRARGQANPQVIQVELDRQLQAVKKKAE